jgi:integral membrane protein
MLLNLAKTALGRLRIIAFLEGVSALILFGIAMPLKYLAGYKEAVSVVGMAHGILFILYIIMLIQVVLELSWGWKKFILGFLASIIPFGTFVADAKIFKQPHNPL